MPKSEESVEMRRSAIMTATQAAAGLLLLFAGWGFGDLPAYFRVAARAGLAALIVLGAVGAIVLGVETQPLRKGLLATQKQSLQLGILLLLALSLLAFLPFADRRNLLTIPSLAMRYAGLACCTLGGVVRLYAMRDLGSHFSAYVTLQPEHRLVERGVYGSIRHPLYLSLLLVPAGIAMVFTSLLALPIFALAAIFVADRISQEEKMLAEHFGSQFSAYQSRTWMLIPGLF